MRLTLVWKKSKAHKITDGMLTSQVSGIRFRQTSHFWFPEFLNLCAMQLNILTAVEFVE